MLSKQSLHLARSIYISHGELNVIACVVLGIAVSGLILHLKAKELPNDPEFKASLRWYQNWKQCHSISLRTSMTKLQYIHIRLAYK